MKILAPSKKSYVCVHIFGLMVLALFVVDFYYALGKGVWFIIVLLALLLMYAAGTYFHAQSYLKICAAGIEKRLLFFTETAPVESVSAIEINADKGRCTVIATKSDGTGLKIEMDMWANEESRREFIDKVSDLATHLHQ